MAENCKNVSIPLKLNILDIKNVVSHPTEQYRFIYKNMVFKNLHIHGQITEIISHTPKSRFQLTDYTDTIDVFFHPDKSIGRIPEGAYSELCNALDKYVDKCKNSLSDDRKEAMFFIKNRIEENSTSQLFNVGDFVSVIGEIFVDKTTEKRCVSSILCTMSSLEEDFLWVSNMCFLNEHFYSQNPTPI